MKLKKELGLLEVFCISSGAMISSGLFVLPGLAYAYSGPGLILAYLIASILILPTVLSKAELTTAMPKTGGIFFFTDRSMGPLMGTLGGLAAWFSLAFKTAFALIGMGIFIVLFNPGFTLLQIKLLAIASCLVFMVINLYGVKLSAKFQVGMVIILFILLFMYILVGIFFIRFERYSPFIPMGLGSIFTTAGLVFVSFAGTTKIAAVAGEVKNPGRNLPLGMLLSWGIVSIVYILVIFVTIGVINPADLNDSLIPISLGGSVMMGSVGLVIMSFAGLLAFVSTGNAGLLAASRDPYAMGKDGLLPNVVGKVSKYGTPWVAIVLTSVFMISFILFLELEEFVKTASTLKLILFILANLALIFMRESNIRHYRPKFKAPFYPWIQIIGIVGYGFLIFEMGTIPLILVSLFIIIGLSWYFIYAHGRIKREYALLHVAERVTGIKTTDHLLDEELREILIDRDDIIQTKFEDKIKNCVVIDLKHFVPPEEFAKVVAKPLAKRLKLKKEDLFKRLMKREKDSNIIVRPGFAVISFHIKGRKRFEIALVRTKRGAIFSEDEPPVHAAFIIVSSVDMENFYLHSLMWMVEIEEELDFGSIWKDAKNEHELRDVFLSAFRKREEVLKDQTKIDED